MAASLLGLGLFLGGARVPAQGLPLPPPPVVATTPAPISLPPAPAAEPAPARATPPREKTLHFSRDPVPALAISTGFPSTPTMQRLQPIGQGFQGASNPRMRETRREQQAEESVQYTVPLEPPGPQRLFIGLQSDQDLMERIRQEKRSQSTVERIIFPEEAALAKVAYAGRQWLPLKEQVEPSYVIYRRLLFEQKNTERYGWDVGVVTPPLCAARFFWDVVTLPYHAGCRPLQQYDSSAGYCLPGDPVPLRLYPPEWSLTGLALETAVVLPLVFGIP
jgi:hypothetical protein